MESKWVCLVVNAGFRHGDKDAIIADVKGIFGSDLDEMRLVCDDGLDKSGENFAFVKCRSYGDHVDALKSSMAVLRVVSSYENPSFLSESEVDTFSASIEEVEEKNVGSLVYGDIVVVKESEKDKPHLGRLTGIVVSMPGEPLDKTMVQDGCCGVYFKLYSKQFCESLSVESLELKGNVFEHVVVPPFGETIGRGSVMNFRDKARKAACGLVSSDKICRKRRRTFEAYYGS